MAALRGQAQPTAPFWLMRQAGRYLPEYRALRARAGSFLDLCFNPELAAEVTLQPIRRFDMDAAILFSDILVIPYALGQSLSFVEGEGPRLGNLTVKTLRYDAEKLAPVCETLRRVRKELRSDKALIGFAGAPWTVACYMVEGQGGGEFIRAKSFAYANPDAFDQLIAKIIEATVDYLVAQAEAGADAVQLFDSWAGLVPEPYFTRWVIRPSQLIRSMFKRRCPDIPMIGFPRGAGALYPRYAAQTGVDGLGLDTQVPLDWARKELGSACLQGNLDPVALLTGGKALETAARNILEAMKGQAFIFNLGHGVIKETPPDHVAQLAQIIRSHAA
ncbi:MAG TPA: uroporphyrinogen decarboxylase [Patescibacteria group bacterium]|nr:uroporphyrinogen decarboxylase [Patescibacteria group bacterium]